jgi:hypothetical protein
MKQRKATATRPPASAGTCRILRFFASRIATEFIAKSRDDRSFSWPVELTQARTDSVRSIAVPGSGSAATKELAATTLSWLGKHSEG